MKRNATLLALLAGLLVAGPGFAEEPIKETRTALEKWVETKQMISKQRADWAAEKELLTESIKMFEKESKNLDELIAKVDSGNEVAKKEHAEQTKLDAEYKEAVEKVKTLVTALEKKVVVLAKTFPPPLAEKLEQFVKRIPEDSENTKLSVGQRVQVLVAVLAEADKFNSAVSLISELRKNASGTEIQVRAIYLGLAEAYYVDKEGKLAGVGTPSAEGWQWSNEPALAPDITRVIAMYENAEPAAFVNLPAKVQ